MIREDKRGHWPKGRRRHALDPARHQRVMQQLRTLLESQAVRGKVSARVLAAHLGVSEATIRRWLSEVDLPPPATLRKIEAWVNRMNRDSR